MNRVLIAGLSLLAIASSPALADGDAAAGEKVFRKCKACHTVGEEAKNKVGPLVNEVIGRQAGMVDDFKYSPAMADAGTGGLVWDEASLDAFLTKPKEFMSGTKMTFPGLRKEEDRADVIAYLMTFSPAAE